jgi:glutaminyl-peptide cyclotransferase
LSRQEPSLIMAEIKTFKTVFPNSYFFAVAWPERTDSQNVMLIGYNSETRVDLNSRPILANRDPLIRSLPSKVIDVDRRFDLSPYPILTDNFSPVEFLTARVLRRAFAEQKLSDGDEMIADVAQQRRYGPRYPGTAGHNKERDFLLAEMKLLAQDVQTQTWQSPAEEGKTYELTNIIGRFYTAERRLVIATHYGGSPPLGKDEPGSASGRNDGSGVAVLVELARSFGDSNLPPEVGIDLVFLDRPQLKKGESASAHAQGVGSTYFAQHLSNLYGDSKPVSAIILDDVCRENLRLLREDSSMRNAAAQVQAFWSVGERLAPSIFQDGAGPEIDDDQTPLIQAGIPTVVLVDSQYPRFDTSEDSPTKCNARSLGSIGRALMQYISLPRKPSTW